MSEIGLPAREQRHELRLDSQVQPVPDSLSYCSSQILLVFQVARNTRDITIHLSTDSILIFDFKFLILFFLLILHTKDIFILA